MSSPEQRSRQWHFFVQDMIDFCEKALAYTEGMTQEAFVEDSRTYDATLRNLGLVGEAATHIPVAVRDAHPEIPWRAVIGPRNHIVHAYLGIDDDTVWSIIQDAIPTILPQLRRLLETNE